MGGHIIIRSKTREALEEPLSNASLPDTLRAAVNAILAKANADWNHAECFVLSGAIAWLNHKNPNS